MMKKSTDLAGFLVRLAPSSACLTDHVIVGFKVVGRFSAVQEKNLP